MSKSETTDRIMDLLDKMEQGELTEAENEELETLSNLPNEGNATAEQKEYIEILLDRLGEDLRSYTLDDNVCIDNLNFDEASDLIDNLKVDTKTYNIPF